MLVYLFSLVAIYSVEGEKLVTVVEDLHHRLVVDK